jgi:hypothetical protein
MKNFSTQLETFLNSKAPMMRADLFTITLANGQVLHTTSWATDLSLSSTVYSATKYGVWKRGTVTTTATYDASPETMELSVNCDQTILFPGSNTPFLQTVASTIFDKATVLVKTAYLPTTFNSIGAAAPVVDPNLVGTKFLGDIITSADPLTSSAATFQVSDWTYRLQNPWPRKLVQSGCSNTVYDKNCGLLKAAFTVSNTVAAGSTALIINLGSALAQAAPYYDKGFVTFTSGQNSGLTGTIAKQISTTQIQLSGPFLLPIATGNAVTLTPGCDGLFSTCTVKFSNASKFQGMPFTPDPAKAVTQ